MRQKRAWTAAMTVVGVVAAFAPTSSAAPGSLYNAPRRGRFAAVATVNPQATDVALDVLSRGGNAVDAAVSAMFAVGVTTPAMCGLGGGGVLVYRSFDGRTSATLDFREAAPAGLTDDDLPPKTSHAPEIADVGGYVVAGVPGVVAGAAEALKRYGRISMLDAVEPAIHLARIGVAITPEYTQWSTSALGKLSTFSGGKTFLSNGLPYVPGQTLYQRELADTLQQIGRYGPNVFYRGVIGDTIATAMTKAGAAVRGDVGRMVKKDLSTYAAKWRTPLVEVYRDAEIVTVPPPAAGGVMLLEMLNLLEYTPGPSLSRTSADYLHAIAEAEKIAFADYDFFAADPDFVSVPARTLSGKAYAARRRLEIDPSRAKASYPPGNVSPRSGSPAPAGPAAAPRGPSHTTSVVVVDPIGNAAAITCSVGSPFGSGVVVPGTGILLNDVMRDFGRRGDANALAPRKRPASYLAPAIVTRNGVPVLVVGGAGGACIPAGVAQTIAGVVDFFLGPGEAIDAPRIDSRCTQGSGQGTTLTAETLRISPFELMSLMRKQHRVLSLGEYGGRTVAGAMTTPVVLAVGISPSTFEKLAAYEPRWESAPGAI